WGYVTAGPATSNLTYTFFNQSTFQYNLPAMDICGMNAYDAVYVATDGEAQLPSSAQMEELLENCDVILASKAGVDGLLLTSKINGKSLFFPLGASSAVYYTGSSNDLKTEVYSVVLNEGSTELSVVLRNTPYIGGYLRGVKFRKEVTLESLVISNPELDVYVANAKQLSVSSVPDGINLENVVWTSSNPAIAEVSASGLVKGIAPGECFVTASLDGIEVSSSVLVSEIAVQSGAYVDMGTNVLWATCNLGARAPYELGDYYAFGAVTTSETPSDYPDNIRGTEYDVAHKELGSSYFIPTPEEYQALIDNTDMEWVIWPTEENPTAQGALLTSRTTGNKLYFRATVRGQVYYNTSMVNTQDPSITQAYHAVEQEQVIGGLSSFIQLPVRAVCTDMTSGVEALVSDSDSSDVYTLSGILVKSGATSADINSLPAGLYIVRNGVGAKKIAIK
ncbi:MAG: Ig-like domain-containing protein, partial [Muribaculaceae bacterium]|nr:Ig-like domain-containing protein [Muribaculaceae bacterium]